MKLIKLNEDHYIVVDDSEIKEGDLFIILSGLGYSVYSIHKAKYEGDGSKGWNDDHCKKITHSTEPLGTKIDGVNFWTSDLMPLSLSEVEEAINGYNVEKMASEAAFCNGGFIQTEYEYDVAISYYHQGFKAHQELVKDKLILDIDTFKSVAYSFFSLHRTNEFDDEELELKFERILNNNIQSLLPKTEWECTFDEQGKLKLL